jgi:hypothetical protein
VISSSKAEGSAGSAICVGIGVVVEGEGEGEGDVMGGEAMMWIVLGYGQWII